MPGRAGPDADPAAIAAAVANDTDELPEPLSCRNSIQGKSLIVDDRGYRPILEEVLAKANGRQVALYAEVTDQFELCLTKCRTNSQSVQNENKYRNPEQKHCYGEMNDALWPSASSKDTQKIIPDDV
uniref:SREBP regulating gene protein n=1 Tax=Anopheles culicifacies TaxID=139723 RepID=A0A182M659_9DIPT